MYPDPLVLHQSKSSARRSVAAILYGAFSFAICSLAAFSVWAFFIFHSAGYFAGGHAMAWIAHYPRTGYWSEISKTHISQMAKLSWGLFYGTGFGAGIGYLFAVCK
ncbi:MAG: hypothetical protein JWN25_1906 [Verrucomicrobiales bacterium]|nr:hypothetical protein [Verrucomicrobiales bacterium]MDB6131302.1 hypothetical protein [Verrucomicrobiales bacterium]